MAAAATSSFAPFEWLLARRYLRARRKEGFISVIAGFSFLGIMLGVMTLIVVMAVMNGFREELLTKMLGINGHAIVHKIGGNFQDYNAVAQRLSKVKGVKAAVPLIEGQVMMSGPSNTAGALVRGMRGTDIQSMTLVAGSLRFGTFEGFDDGDTIAVGTRMANALGVTLGDSVTMVNPRGRTTVFGTKPNIKRYKISAIFEIGVTEYDRSIIFMPLREAQAYFNQPQRVTVLEVLADNPENMDRLKADLVRAGGPEVHVTDWRERDASFFKVLEVERNVMFIILSLIVLVATLNIISGLMMLVKDKGRDIAIMRTMGASKGAVMRIFLITGASIGIVGTLAGLILGVLICWNIDPIYEFVSWMLGREPFDPNVYFLSRLPAKINPWETASVVLMALALSVLATVYPSWKASKTDPVAALRYE
ncbi:MAG: lipoprotein-releasing ABC transporter permease subunit [Hyphomicrobiaceae bacterium]